MLAEQAGDVQARSSVGTARKSRGKARHEERPASGTEQPDPHPCRAASRNSEERRRGRPQSGTAANLGQGHRAGTGTPRKPTAALPTQSGREGRLPRGGTGHSGQGRVLGRVRATGRRSGNRTGCVHRPRQGRTGGRWQKAEGSVTVSEFTHGLLPSTPGVKNEVGREARKRFSLNGNAGVRFGTWS